MQIVVLGAGQVGSAVVEALHDEHELTVVDLDPARLAPLSQRWDVATLEGNGATQSVLLEAGIKEAGLMIACTSRDERNLIGATLAKKLNPGIAAVARAAEVEYIEAWRERNLDVDLVVSSELETAYAVSQALGVPAARQTDVFAGGQVQIVELDVKDRSRDDGVTGRPLRDARIPADSKVASIIRGGSAIVPRGDETIEPGDRIIVIGSPRAARQWSALIAQAGQRLDDVVVYGAGRIGVAVAKQLLGQGMSVRLIESDPARAEEVAERLPKARVFNADGFDPEFLERERIGRARAAVLALQDDPRSHYAATVVKLRGIRFTIAVVNEPASVPVFESAGVDVVVNPRQLTAEELVRFAHDPRTRQVAMLEGDRFEVLDVTVRPDSGLVGRPFRDLPTTGSVIGAIVRDGKAIFPHGDTALQAGDRVIVFTEADRAAEVERAL